ncbi:MAG TPA: hypothetical protein VK484_02805, partial [Ferruginibacter sp.]|nr:hypothetical protein [Ferruginibacter sp.]
MKLSDLGNSFNKIFEERISSPLYGTFIISWLIWNWKIIYLTIFINKDDIQPSNKIQYILDNYINWWVLLWFPLISTVVLITVIPLVANKLYKVHLYYERERTRDKEKSDAGNRLTIRQSADIRNEMMMLVENNQKQIDTKTNELKIARQQIDTWRIERMEYKVLVALYGKNGVYSDVTRIVQDYVTSERSFLVENEVLGGDPLWAVHKELFIIYQFENSIKSIFAREHYQINTTSNYGMEANDTKKSIGIYKDEKQVQNREILSNLFSGTWHLAY